jgi:uncharacterized RDD family membrane protein YckC
VAAPEKLTIETPEQITLEFPLAGIGSRFLAIAFDTVLQAAALVSLVFIGLAAGIFMSVAGARRPQAGGIWLTAVLLFAWFVIYTGYFAIFESVWNGQTPGKRLVGLRVIDVSGRPITVYAALIRNILRILDSIPGIYAVAIISAIVTKRNQRLGDLAAGTLVIHERTEAIAPPSATVETTAARHGAHRLQPGDIVLIEGFLRRRTELDPLVRLESARRIAERMAAKLGIGVVDDEERLLEQLATEYRSADRYR